MPIFSAVSERGCSGSIILKISPLNSGTRDRKMILGAIRRLDLLKGEHPLSAFVSQTFPELWEEARKESCEGGCEESWQTP